MKYLNLLVLLVCFNFIKSHTDSFIQMCLEDLIRNALPMKATDNTCQLAVQHGEAHNGKWQMEIRFKPFPESIKADTTDVIYLGGNTEAADSINLKEMLPNLKSMHIIEPVPIFFQELKKNMAKYSSWAHLYPIGLGNSNRNISISPNDLKGQGTFVMNTTGGDIVLNILTPRDFFGQINFTGTLPLPVLHVNCEGCEYEVFETLIQEKMLDRFSVINISFHYMAGIDKLFTRYCKIREHFLASYTMDPQSIAFGWERWLRKHNQTSSRR